MTQTEKNRRLANDAIRIAEVAFSEYLQYYVEQKDKNIIIHVMHPTLRIENNLITLRPDGIYNRANIVNRLSKVAQRYAKQYLKMNHY